MKSISPVNREQSLNFTYKKHQFFLILLWFVKIAPSIITLMLQVFRWTAVRPDDWTSSTWIEIFCVDKTLVNVSFTGRETEIVRIESFSFYFIDKSILNFNENTNKVKVCIGSERRNSTGDAEGVITQQNICLCCKNKGVNPDYLSDLTLDLQP